MSWSISKEEQFDAWLAITRQTPPPDGPVRLPMLSGSMLPAIPVGYILRIELCSAASCRVGDVILYQDCERLVAHRLLTAGPWPWWLEKGDANPTGRWLHRKRILGRVATVAAPEDPNTDVAVASETAAAVSRRRHSANLLLAAPRWVRARLRSPGREPS